MNKKEKAQNLLSKGKVFFEGENKFYELWLVVGNKDIYQVSYSKSKKEYNCTCKNVRLTSCYHIEAVILKKGDKND